LVLDWEENKLWSKATFAGDPKWVWKLLFFFVAVLICSFFCLADKVFWPFHGCIITNGDYYADQVLAGLPYMTSARWVITAFSQRKGSRHLSFA
jgi:hypothetical protein